jgi:hypothetical protein
MRPAHNPSGATTAERGTQMTPAGRGGKFEWPERSARGIVPVAEAQNMFEFWDELWARVFARLQHFGLKVPDDGCCGVYSCDAGPGGDLDAEMVLK